MDNTCLVSRINDICSANGLSVGALERKLGWSQNLVNTRWLKQGTTPGADKLLQLSDELDVSIDFLLKGNEEIKDDKGDVKAGYSNLATSIDNNKDSVPEEKECFTKKLIESTESRDTIWYKLNDGQTKFRQRVIREVCTYKYSSRQIYYSEEEKGSFILSVQWDGRKGEDIFDIALFTIPYNISAYHVNSVKQDLLHLIEIIDEEVFDKLIELANKDMQMEFLNRNVCL